MSATLEPPTLDERMPSSRGILEDDPHFDPQPPRELSELLASPPLVSGRKRSSAFLAAWSATLTRAGVGEACDALNELEQAKAKADPDYKPEHFDANEVRRVLMTVCEALQKVEADAEREGRSCPRIRRGKLAAFQLETYYRREPVPFKTELPDVKERERLVNALARAWRRRWRKAHAVECYLHLAFVSKEKGVAGKSGKTPPAYTDRLTDLVVAVAVRAAALRAELGDHLRRYTNAADELLAEFRADPANYYAPEWKPGDSIDAAGDEDEKPAKPPKAKDPREPARRAVRAAVREGLKIVAALNLSEDEEIEFRLELQAEFETAWTSEPKPTGGGGARKERGAGETLNADTASANASARVSTRTNMSALKEYRVKKNAENSQSLALSAAENPTFSPAGKPCLTTAELAASVCASVGAERFGVVVIDDTKERGEEGSCIFDETVSPARFRDRLPYYLAQNERNPVASVSVRLRSTKHDYGLHFLQVDDATPADVELLKPFAFWGAETSPGSAQVWLALAEKLTAEQYNELRQRLFDRLNPTKVKALANGGAFGAIRWIGSLNRKPKRRLADGTSPRVEFLFFAHGRRVTVAELDGAGLLAPAVVKASNVVEATSRFKTSRVPFGDFPPLDDYLSKHRKPDGSPDRSSAEIAWCCASLRLGFSESAVEDELSRLTLKGRGRSYAYVRDTVAHAAAFLARQPDTSRGARERLAL